jgi:anti-sigma regulatory factor (Ser/Thr protein kinase)
MAKKKAKYSLPAIMQLLRVRSHNDLVELVEQVRHEPREVSRVRHRLAAELIRWGVNHDDTDVAVLLTSEVVTNAIRYGLPPVELRAALLDGQLRIAVADSGGEEVMPTAEVDWDDSGGRGLLLVESLAHAWGVNTDHEGKHVWFELQCA